MIDRLAAGLADGMLEVSITRHLGERALRRRLDETTTIISAVSHDLRSPIAATAMVTHSPPTSDGN